MEYITFITPNWEEVKTTDYGYRLTGFDQSAIEPRVSTVEIPGRDGVLDMSEALTGDVIYENYTTTITGLNIDRKASLSERESSYTQLKNAIQGRYVDFIPSFDADYTRRGRVTSVTCKDRLTYATVQIEIDTEPYKSKGLQTLAYNVAEGIVAYPDSGRKMTRPTFDLTASTVIIFGNDRYELPKGAYQLADVIFTQGANELFMIDAAVQSYITHEELAGFTHSYIGTAKPIYEWYKGQHKYIVDEITLEGTDPFITGTLTFSATDEFGNVASATLDLGESFIGSMSFTGEDEETTLYTDKLVIKDGEALLYKQVILSVNLPDEETGEVSTESIYSPAIEPMVEVFTFPQLFSLAGEIVSITNAEGYAFTYTTGEKNMAIDYDEATHEDYSEAGSVAMTNEALKEHRHGDLRYINRGTVEVMNADNKTMAYIQYEWLDL